MLLFEGLSGTEEWLEMTDSSRLDDGESMPFQYKGPFAIDKSTPKYFALSRKENMSVQEFAAFYCGIDLRMLRGYEHSEYSEEWVEYIAPIAELIEKDLRSADPDLMADPADKFKNGAWYLWNSSVNGVSSVYGLVFDIETYEDFLLSNNLPLPIEWKPILESRRRVSELTLKLNEGKSSNSKASYQIESPENQSIVPNDMEVVAGLTVGKLRELLDEKNEGKTFCPVLLASARTAIEVAAARQRIGSQWSPSAEKRHAINIAEKKCVELGILTADSGAKGKDKLEPSKADKEAVARCSRLSRQQSKR